MRVLKQNLRSTERDGENDLQLHNHSVEKLRNISQILMAWLTNYQ